MTDSATLTRWIDALDPNLHQQVSIQQGASNWTVTALRSVQVDAVRAELMVPGANANPTELMTAVANAAASGYQLVKAIVTEQGSTLAIQFWAPVFDEGLTQQAFLLTVSSVLKAAGSFDMAQAMRRDELAAVAQVRAEADRIRQTG
jgi:hypothetical protein